LLKAACQSIDFTHQPREPMPTAQRKQEVTGIMKEAERVILLCKTEQIHFVEFVWFCGLPDGAGDTAFISTITRNHLVLWWVITTNRIKLYLY